MITALAAVPLALFGASSARDDPRVRGALDAFV